MVCTRNLQLSVRKTTGARTFKTLEGTILMMKDGEKNTMSSRVAEMNTMMPMYLGVSKAILDNVIFCHQDESLWPLAAPADLKKRFDEIFEAMKYTKAIENIKLLQKNQRAALIEHRKDAEFAKINKEKGKKIEKQAEKLNAECEELRKQHADFEDRIKQAARNAEAAWQKAETAGMIVGELTGKRIQQHTKEESVQSLRQNLQEMSEPDDVLQRMLEQYEERVQRYEEDLNKQKQQYGNLSGEIQQARNRVSAKERECGTYEAEAQRYDRQVQSRGKVVKETARSHNIRGFDMEIDDSQVREFMDRITKMARDQNAAFERARRETHEALQGAQNILSEINQRKTSLTSKKESSRQSIATNDSKIENLQSELNRIHVDEGGKATMEISLRDTETRLQNAKWEMKGAGWDDELQATEAELRTLDGRKEILEAELVEGTRQAKKSAHLDFIKKELTDRETRLETMCAAHTDKISMYLGNNWSPQTIDADFQRILAEHQSQVTDAERQRDGVSREKEQLDYQLNACKKDLFSKKQSLKEAADKIREVMECEPADYPMEMRDLEQGVDELKSDTESSKMLFEYFSECIKAARSNQPACRTCTKPLKNAKEVDVLIKRLEKERKDVEEQIEDAPEQLKKAEETLKNAKSVNTHFDTWNRLKEKEIPSAETLEKELMDKREKLIDQLESHDEEVGLRQAAKRDVEAISRTVETIAKLNTDILVFKQQVEELSATQQASGMSRGLDQIQNDIMKVNDEVRAVKAHLLKVTGDRERARNQINGLELELRDIQSKLSTAEYQLKEKRSLEKQIEEVKNLSNAERDAVDTINKELQELVPQLSQAQVKYDDIARRGAEKDRELQAEVNKLSSSINQLKMANEEIEAYEAKGGRYQLTSCRREVEQLQNEVTRLEDKQNIIIRSVKALEDQLRNSAETKRSIADNQRYRRDLRALQQVREEIAELEKHNAEEDKARYEQEGTKWQMQRNKLAAEQATVIGSLKSKDENLVQLLADYDTDYKDAARKYKEAHIKLEATKACVEDLGRYGGALDKAIMKFHSLKMEEINRIIGELWRKTYQGTDVDTILIRSESENIKSNKSYNYRVCMVKQDAEMDMRGRCSAGQKVLASIIIRLALAECFGVNCGLIALDEPTTNLDHENIRALAESLSEIIQVRRQQKNFQLIVITHDEDFLRYMNCGDFADVYYRVSRSESQKSRIERQSIAEVI